MAEAHRQEKIELVRLRATYSMPHYEPPRYSFSHSDPADAARGNREVIWCDGAAPVTIYEWEALCPGQTISAEAILESATTTYPVPPGWTLHVDEFGNGQLTRG